VDRVNAELRTGGVREGGSGGSDEPFLKCPFVDPFDRPFDSAQDLQLIILMAKSSCGNEIVWGRELVPLRGYENSDSAISFGNQYKMSHVAKSLSIVGGN